MKQKYGTKSSFHKLYLIDSEMYNRILHHLNEVDKQEINALNENNPSYHEMNDEALDQGNNESKQDPNPDPDPDEANKIETSIFIILILTTTVVSRLSRLLVGWDYTNEA